MAAHEHPCGRLYKLLAARPGFDNEPNDVASPHVPPSFRRDGEIIPSESSPRVNPEKTSDAIKLWLSGFASFNTRRAYSSELAAFARFAGYNNIESAIAN